MNFFGIDQHIAVMSDVRHVFNSMGHTVRHVCLSGHIGCVGMRKIEVPMLAGDKWCGFHRRNGWDEFEKEYGDVVRQHDGIVCCFPPIFSLLYRNFDMPIIVNIPIRYEYGTDGDKEGWQLLNEYWREGIDKGKIFLVANSLYDKHYTEAFVEREVTYIPSLCEYTGMSYNPTIQQSIYYASFHVKNAPKDKLLKKHDVLESGHAWQRIADFQSVAWWPYNISIMSIFEQYAAGIPLFFPSEEHLLSMYARGVPVLGQMSWNKTYQKQPHSLLTLKGPHDPNDYTNEASMRHWLSLADYYQRDWMPHLKYFSSMSELIELINMPQQELMDISSQMKEAHVKRHNYAYKMWGEILEQVQRCIE